MAADSGIDPRYAAQFQRGFDPAQHAVTPLPERRGPEPIESPAPPVVRLVPPPPPIVERQLPSSAPDVDGSPAIDESEVRLPSAWRWALPALAVALVAAAALAFGSSATETGMYSGNWTQEDYVASSMRAQLPGPLFVAGVVAFTAWAVARGMASRVQP